MPQNFVFVRNRDSQSSMITAGYPHDMFAAQKIVFTDDEDENTMKDNQ